LYPPIPKTNHLIKKLLLPLTTLFISLPQILLIFKFKVKTDIGGSLFGYQQDNNYLKVLNGHSKMGSWGEEDGSKTYGTETQGSVLDSQFDLLNGFSKMDPNSTDKQKDFWTLNTSFLNAYGGAKFNKNNGMFLGAGASLFDISTRFGTSGTGNRDSNTKLGYSLGPALGGGLHWSDDDHDGIPEYGFRIDTPLGLSIDTKSEDPVRDYFLNSIMGPGAMALNPEDNLTQDLSNFNAQHILKLVQMSQQASNAIGNFGLSMLGLESK